MGLLCESCVYSIAFKRNCKKFCDQKGKVTRCGWFKEKEDLKWSDNL